MHINQLKRAGSPADIHVGQRIKMARLEAGLSQTALGEAVGLSFQQIQKFEKGANRVASGRLADIARALNRPIGFFFAHASCDGAEPDRATQMATDRYGADIIEGFLKLTPARRQQLRDMVVIFCTEAGDR